MDIKQLYNILSTYTPNTIEISFPSIESSTKTIKSIDDKSTTGRFANMSVTNCCSCFDLIPSNYNSNNSISSTQSNILYYLNILPNILNTNNKTDIPFPTNNDTPIYINLNYLHLNTINLFSKQMNNNSFVINNLNINQLRYGTLTCNNNEIILPNKNFYVSIENTNSSRKYILYNEILESSAEINKNTDELNKNYIISYLSKNSQGVIKGINDEGNKYIIKFISDDLFSLLVKYGSLSGIPRIKMCNLNIINPKNLITLSNYTKNISIYNKGKITLYVTKYNSNIKNSSIELSTENIDNFLLSTFYKGTENVTSTIFKKFNLICDDTNPYVIQYNAAKNKLCTIINDLIISIYEKNLSFEIKTKKDLIIIMVMYLIYKQNLCSNLTYAQLSDIANLINENGFTNIDTSLLEQITYTNISSLNLLSTAIS